MDLLGGHVPAHDPVTSLSWWERFANSVSFLTVFDGAREGLVRLSRDGCFRYSGGEKRVVSSVPLSDSHADSLSMCSSGIQDPVPLATLCKSSSSLLS